jgi:N-acetyl sugar amidotransferase
MNRCISCLRPNTLPGVEFNEEGVCPACERYANREQIDWERRRDFLKNLCNEHRHEDGSFDCIIPVSGGKDSFFQVHTLKNELKMHPLLVCVTDPFTHTPEGKHNYEQIARAFKCDTITLRLDPEQIAQTSLLTLEKIGSTNWVVDKAIYAWPLQIALQTGIKLIVYGENVSWEYGGPNAADTYDANEQIMNRVVAPLPENLQDLCDGDFLRYPTVEAIGEAKLQAIYLSWFYPWNDFTNLRQAECYGFHRLRSFKRAGYIDDYAQIDSVGYLFNYYLKFMKYGIGRVTDIGSRWVRYGHFTKAKLAWLIREEEGKFDLQIAADFCNMIGRDWDSLRSTVSKWWNRDIFNVAPGSMEWGWKEIEL